MIPYQKEKIENAIVFFALEHRKKTQQHLHLKSLNKYLAFLDFYSLRETGQPVLELTYEARQYGPVPVEIYETKTITSMFKIQPDDKGEFLVYKGRPNLDYFSSYEVNLMKRLIEIFAQSWITAMVMSDASHQEIKAWVRTRATQPDCVIDYALEFDGDVFSKDEEELTYPEEVFLTYRALMS